MRAFAGLPSEYRAFSRSARPQSSGGRPRRELVAVPGTASSGNIEAACASSSGQGRAQRTDALSRHDRSAALDATARTRARRRSGPSRQPWRTRGTSSATNNRSARSARMRGDLRDALEHGALEIEFQHHAKATGQRRIERDREVQTEHVPGFEQILKGRQRPWLAGLRRAGICRPRWAEGPVNGGVLIEQRQEHRHAFDDRGFHLRVEPDPGVVVPPMDRLQPVTTIRADCGISCAELEGDALAGKIGLQFGIVRVRIVVAPIGAHRSNRPGGIDPSSPPRDGETSWFLELIRERRMFLSIWSLSMMWQYLARWCSRR